MAGALSILARHRTEKPFSAGHSWKHSIPGLRMLVMIGLWAYPRGDDGSTRGVTSHGLMLDCCLPSRRLAGRALEERSLTARKSGG